MTVALVLLLVGAAGAHATEQDQDAPGNAAPVARDYCSSFVDSAAERRLLNLKADLERAKTLLSAEIEELKSRTRILQSIVDERKQMQSKVSDSLVKIYLEIEPEAAAMQLSKLEPSTAAEILVRMSAKRSGEILTSMDPKRAASLVALLTLQTKPMKE